MINRSGRSRLLCAVACVGLVLTGCSGTDAGVTAISPDGSVSTVTAPSSNDTVAPTASAPETSAAPISTAPSSQLATAGTTLASGTTPASGTAPASPAPTTIAGSASVLSLIQDSGDLSRLERLVDALSSNELFNWESVTLLAPVDAAWEDAYSDEEFDDLLTDPDEVARIVSEHLSVGTFSLVDLVAQGSFTSATARSLPVQQFDDVVLIGSAVVVEADVAATNGVIHKIDAIIEPLEE